MKAKFKEGDKVKFKIRYSNTDEIDHELFGIISRVDEWGTFRYPDKVCYDIMVNKGDLPVGLYKYIWEENLTKVEELEWLNLNLK